MLSHYTDDKLPQISSHNRLFHDKLEKMFQQYTFTLILSLFVRIMRKNIFVHFARIYSDLSFSVHDVCLLMVHRVYICDLVNVCAIIRTT